MSVERWFAQPADVRGTAILLPGRLGGASTPLLHWPAALLTERGWSVLVTTWSEDAATSSPADEVVHAAGSALAGAQPGRPVLVVAKSLGTWALPWAVRHGLPGAWLTPLLGEASVVAGVAEAQAETLLVGGSADPHWQVPAERGPGIDLLELPGTDHGLQQPGGWRTSLLGQVTVFDRIAALADRALHAGRTR